MAFELPAGGTTTNETNILTKIPNGLNSLRDGSAITYSSSSLNVLGGTADAITLATNPLSTIFLSEVDGKEVTINPLFSNTGTATLKLDSLVARTIKKRQNGVLVDLISGDIKVGVQAKLTFFLLDLAWILETPLSKKSASTTFALGILTGGTISPLQTFTHGLGTDSVVIHMQCDVKSHNHLIKAIRPDGMITVANYVYSGQVFFMASPASGDISLLASNAGITEEYNVRVTVTREE